MAEWDEQLILSKYHLSIAKRLFENFDNYRTKNFLINSLNELAISASFFLNSFLIYLYIMKKVKIPNNPKERINLFIKETKKLFMNEKTNLVLKIFEIKKAQKESPIEYFKKNKIILLDNGEYKAITIKRLKEFLNEMNEVIKEFSDKIKNQ